MEEAVAAPPTKKTKAEKKVAPPPKKVETSSEEESDSEEEVCIMTNSFHDVVRCSLTYSSLYIFAESILLFVQAPKPVAKAVKAAHAKAAPVKKPVVEESSDEEDSDEDSDEVCGGCEINFNICLVMLCSVEMILILPMYLGDGSCEGCPCEEWKGSCRGKL